MGGYRVRVMRTKRLRQKFHVRIESATPPFETLFWSEQYRDRGYALTMASIVAGHLHAAVIDET